MKVHVDPERCQGHTLCAMIAPDMFELDEVDGHSSPVSEQVPGGNVGSLFSHWPGLTYLWNEGTDFRRSYDVFRRATELCRSGQGRGTRNS